MKYTQSGYKNHYWGHMLMLEKVATSMLFKKNLGPLMMGKKKLLSYAGIKENKRCFFVLLSRA